MVCGKDANVLFLCLWQALELLTGRKLADQKKSKYKILFRFC